MAHAALVDVLRPFRHEQAMAALPTWEVRACGVVVARHYVAFLKRGVRDGFVIFERTQRDNEAPILGMSDRLCVSGLWVTS